MFGHRGARVYLRYAQRVARRSMGGGSPVGDRSSLYGRLMIDHPLPTSVATATVLWATGDLIAQQLDRLENKDAEFNVKRFTGVCFHGFLLGGFGNYYWYLGLEQFVSNTLRLTAGSLLFVGAKIGLEVMLWHPVGLLAYWCIIGSFEGHSRKKIKRELKKDYVPTLVADICLWTPCDIVNFWLIPVQYQSLFINFGSLIEAVALSWVHKHGSESPSAEGKGKGRIQEEKTSVAAMFSAVESLLHLSISRDLSREEIKRQIDAQFHRLDTDKNGFLTLNELQSGLDLLPGINDAAVSSKVLEILHRLADSDVDGRVSKDEYTRLILRFSEGGYRREILPDVVIAIYDKNNDGFIDAEELANILRVSGLGHSPADVKIVMEEIDANKDGKISRDELSLALRRQS